MRRAFLLLALLATTASAQTASDSADDARRALTEARAEGTIAATRAARLEATAATATAEATRTASEAAAVAARIQQAQAEIAADAASIRLIADSRARLRASLAERQRPLLRLTAALQRLSRRPLLLALLRPGSVRDAMHLRALLETMLPEIRRRTADLRTEIARGHALEAQARAAQLTLATEQHTLGGRRQMLAGLETRQRLAARDVSGSADREAERALALSEQARDLTGLVDTLARADALEDVLARLPGPVMRPSGAPRADIADEPGAPIAQPAHLVAYGLPVAGRLTTGFGGVSRGIAIATRGGAQVVAPAGGRVGFAGPYRGFGQIVILTHPGGWTSLVTGMAQLDVRTGDALVAGAPLGIIGPEASGPGHARPVLTLELRHDGQPVNPLDELRD